MSTHFDNEFIRPSEWVSQVEAAQLRGVSRQAIARLVREGRFTTIIVGGHVLLKREEVLAFQPRPTGRRKKQRKPEHE